MIKIGKDIIKKQPNFWSNALFHPTDAVEDSWGKRILDQMAKDHAVKTIRIYTMFEDIVYYDGDGKLQFDFRVSDLRIDYLLGLGYDLILSYAGIPDCIAQSTCYKSSMSNGATRYKGKMWNTSMPRDIAVWEDICYEYTKHNIERYGLGTVSKWWLQCFNEPDAKSFFLGDVEKGDEGVMMRCEKYCELYEAFVCGVCRASDLLRIGGPALAGIPLFLEGFLKKVKEKELRLDFISLHNYGTHPSILERNDRKITLNATIEKQEKYLEIIKEQGFADTDIILDEWGVATSGFKNMTEFPVLEYRETEVFSAYYVKMISEFIRRDYKISKLLICLSGQHEMKTDFTGFRNFFTLNFIRKPIYNAHVLASGLHDGLVSYNCENSNIFVIPTKDECGNYSVLLSYSSEYFDENIETITEEIVFADELGGNKISIYRIDRDTTNPYRLYKKNNMGDLTAEDIQLLREEGKLSPVYTGTFNESEKLVLTPNSTYFISIER